MQKKILLICNYFAPDHAIAAVRTSKLAKYLRKSGYEIHVIAEKKESVLEDEILKRDVEGIRISYACQSDLYKSFHKRYEQFIQPHKKKRFDNLENRYRINPKTKKMEFYPYETAYPFLGSLDYIVSLLKQYDLFFCIKKMLKYCGDFDYVITSYGDAFGLLAGCYYHKYHPRTPWIFDIRDAVYRYKFTPCYVGWIAKIYEKQIWKNADCILGVSKGICKRVPSRYRKKVHCLTNGYDVSDRNGLSTRRLDTPKMAFTYTGSMYGGIQDLSVLFKAVREAISQGSIKEEQLEFHYAGNDSAYPIHLDDEYAKRTLFKKRIAHALFCINGISMVIGNHLPGEGTVLISQKFQYIRPVYIGDVIKITVTVVKVLSESRYLLETICENQENDIVLKGESLVK